MHTIRSLIHAHKTNKPTHSNINKLHTICTASFATEELHIGTLNSTGGSIVALEMEETGKVEAEAGTEADEDNADESDSCFITPNVDCV